MRSPSVFIEMTGAQFIRCVASMPSRAKIDRSPEMVRVTLDDEVVIEARPSESGIPEAWDVVTPKGFLRRG
jgi:uncharacterized protein (DUF427 family)